MPNQNQPTPHLLRRRPKLHLAIIGEGGGGKSYLAQAWGSQPGRRCIYFDYMGKIELCQFDYYADNLKLLEYGMMNLEKFAFITSDRNLLVSALELVWNTLTSINLLEPVYLVLDEIQFYSDEDVIEKIFHAGRKFNVFGVLVSRNLQDTVHKNAGIISQCTDIMLVGGLTDVGLTRLRSNYNTEVPDDVRAHIQEWHWEDDKRVSNHNSAFYDMIQWDLYNAKFQHMHRIVEKEEDKA